MTEWKPVRLRRGRVIHATDADKLRRTGCGYLLTGAKYAVDEAPTCKRCLRAMLDALN